MKYRTATLTTMALLALAGCSTSDAAPEPSVTPAAPPSLSVPETTNDRSVTVRVNPGGLNAGDNVRISAFGGDFDTEEITCNEEVAGADIRVSGGEQEQNATVQLPSAGHYQLTLSAPGYSSSCDSDNARTVAKSTPAIQLDGNLDADGNITYERVQGKPFDVSVILSDGVPKLRPLPVELQVLGPYSTEPELRASQCNPDKVISSTSLQWEGKDSTGTRSPYDTTQLTIDDVKGLYLVVGKVKETEQSYEAETICDNYQSVMKVAVEKK